MVLARYANTRIRSEIALYHLLECDTEKFPAFLNSYVNALSCYVDILSTDLLV